MKKNEASQTALMVTMMRALADQGVTGIPGFSDPTAKHFLTGRWLRTYERALKRRPGIVAAGAKGTASLLALRTLAIDAQVKAAIVGGARQLVILGAGFDGRAYRLAELKNVEVYEVDHPATQQLKRERLGALQPIAKSVVHVPVDFERETFAASLQKAGHRATEPTVWIWEGVVMYLSDEAFLGSLRAIASCSAPLSTLIIQYNEPAGIHPLALLLLIWREPMIGHRSRHRMENELRAVGFNVFDDVGVSDWSARFGGEPLHHRLTRHARILSARRS